MTQMTYPRALYDGESGQVAAWVRRSDREPDLVRTTGTRVDYLATGAVTGGLFGLYRWSMGPDAGGADPHFHRTVAESFYVLTGTVKIFDGSGWTDAGVGDFFHVPPGGIHGFSNESGLPASMLIHFAPGAPREAYFEGLNDLAAMTEEERAAFFVAHDNLFI
jgi:mannose-6-phosphate isomerase-like protein (cupin superfamily)